MRLKQIAASAGVLVAVLAILAVIGLDPPKVATQAFVATTQARHQVEYLQLVGEVLTLEQRSLEQAIESNEIRAGNLRVLVIQMTEKNMDVAPVKKQVRRLERQIGQFESELKTLRSR